MDAVVLEIVRAKKNVGELSFLSLSLEGECILLDREPRSTSDTKTLGRWQLNREECDQLLDTGLVDLAV